MYRPIIFRGKRQKADGGGWVYGSLIQDDPEWAAIYSFHHTYSGTTSRIDPNTAGQCIGMQDMKTIEVYEDDIVRDYVSGVHFVVVFTDYGNFGLKSLSPNLKDHEYETIDPSYVSTTLRVIGNIHDNPELIK